MISDPISRLFQISKNNPKQIAISENNRNINYRDFFKSSSKLIRQKKILLCI